MSCFESIRVEDNKSFRELETICGSDRSKFYEYLRTVCKPTSTTGFLEFTKEFTDWWNETHKSVLDPNKTNTKTLANAIIKYYNETTPTFEAGLRDTVLFQKVFDFGYSDINTRNLAKRIFANRMLVKAFSLTYEERTKAKSIIATCASEAINDIRCNLADSIAREYRLNPETVYNNLGDNCAEYLDSIVDDRASLELKNQVAFYKEITSIFEDEDGNRIDYRSEFIREVLNDSRLDVLRRDADENEDWTSLDQAVQEEQADDGDTTNDDTNDDASFDMMIRAFEEKGGFYKDYMIHVNAGVKNLLSIVPKLNSDTFNNGYFDKNRDNTLGIGDFHSATELASILYSQGEYYESVDDLIKHLYTLAKNFPGYAGFAWLASKLQENTDLAFEFFNIFSKPVFEFKEVDIENDTSVIRSSNPTVSKLSVLRFNFSRQLKTYSVSSDLDLDTIAKEYNLLDTLVKNETDDNKLIKIYKDKLVYQLRRFYPEITSDTVNNYLYNNVIKGKVDIKENFKKLLDKLRDTIKSANNVSHNYFLYRANLAKLYNEQEGLAAKLAKHDKTVTAEDVNNINEELNKAKRTSYMSETEAAPAYELAKMLLPYTPVKINANTYNVLGNSTSSVANNNFISSIKHIFESILNTADENGNIPENSPIMQYARSRFQSNEFANSNILIETRENGQIINYGLFYYDENGNIRPTKYATELIKFNPFNGTNNRDTDSKATYTKLIGNDFLASAWSAFFTAQSADTGAGKISVADYFIKTPSDSPRTYTIRLPKYNIKSGYTKTTNEDGTTSYTLNRASAIYKHFRKLFISELQNAASALNVIFEPTEKEINGRNVLIVGRRNGQLIYREGSNTDHLHLIDGYHYKGKTIVQGEEGFESLTGNVFKSDKFVVFDTKTNKPKNYGQNIIDNAIDFLYRGDDSRVLYFTESSNGDVVPIVDNYEDVIYEQINAWFDAFVKDAIARTDNIKHFLKGTTYDEDAVISFMINYYLAYNSTNDLLDADSKFYKDSQAILKRIKEILASGKPFAIPQVENNTDNLMPMRDIKSELDAYPELGVRVRNKFRAITIKNSIVNNTKRLNNLMKELMDSGVPEDRARDLVYGKEKDGKRKGGFTNIIANDGQSYISYKEWIRRITLRGEFYKYKPLIDKLNDPNSVISAEDVETFVQIQKNFYYDIHYNKKVKRHTPRQIKNAEVVLVPRFIKGTDLAVLSQLMDDLDISQVNTEEASKTANSYVFEIFDEHTGELKGDLQTLEQSILSDGIDEFDYTHLYTQIDVKQHVYTGQKAGIQFMKKILDNIDENSPLWNVKEEIQSLYSTNIKLSAIDFLRELGINVNDKGEITNIDPSKFDYKKLYNKLKEELLRLGYDSNMEEYVTQDLANPGTSIMPNYMSYYSGKLENITQSMFNNAITRQLMNGFHVVQMSSIGFQKLSSKGTIATDSKLKYHPLSEDGKVQPYMEVKLPLSTFGLSLTSDSAIEYINGKISAGMSRDDAIADLKEFWLKELNRIGADTIIGYRIPTEGKTSMALMKCVEFIDDGMGSTIVVPDEWVAQTGADFDVDTIYGFSYRLKTDGFSLKKVPYYTSTEDNKTLYINYVRRNINDDKAWETFLRNAKLDDDEVKELAEEYDYDWPKVKKIVKAENQRMFDEGLEYLAKKNGLKTFDEFSDMPIEERNTKVARDNKMLDDFKAILSDPSMAEEELSRSNFDSIIDAYDKVLAFSPELAAKRKGRSSYNILDQVEYQTDAMSGYTLKGNSVVYDTFISICNTVKAVVDENKSIDVVYDYSSLSKGDFSRVLEKLITRFGEEYVKHTDDQKITITHNKIGWSKDNLNVADMILTSYAAQTTAHILDAIKSGNIPNVNLFTFGAYKTIVALGSDYDTAVSFIMQPGITRVINKYNATNSIFTEDKDIFRTSIVLNDVLDELEEYGIDIDIAKEIASILYGIPAEKIDDLASLPFDYNIQIAAVNNDFTTIPGVVKEVSKLLKDKPGSEEAISRTSVIAPSVSNIVKKHKGYWTRQEAANNPKGLYIFTDNTDRDSGSGKIPANSWYSKKYGEGHHYPTMTAAVVRGLENSRPISTQRWYHQGAKGTTGRWTDADVIEFKQVIREEIEEIVREFNTGKYDTIMLPDGDGLFNTNISNITKIRTPQLYQALADLLHEYGFDSLIPSDVTPTSSVSSNTLQLPSTTSTPVENISTNDIISLVQQLIAVRQFGKLRNISSDVTNAAMVLNPDKFGAKQSIFKTNEVFDKIANILTDEKFGIFLDNGHKLLEGIYPGIEDSLVKQDDTKVAPRIDIAKWASEDRTEDSLYKMLYSFLKYATASSILVNSKLFTFQDQKIRDAISSIGRLFSDNIRIDEAADKEIRTYIVNTLYRRSRFINQPLMYVKGVGFVYKTADNETPNSEEFARVYGYGYLPSFAIPEVTEKNEFENNGVTIRKTKRKVFRNVVIKNLTDPKENEIADFAKLSPAQKIAFIQKNFLTKGIFDYITPVLDNSARNKNVRTQQSILYNKDAIDVETARALFYSAFTSKNPLIALAAADIIKYAFLVEGYKMSANDVSNIIPNAILLDSSNLYGTSMIDDIKRNEVNIEDIILESGENFIRSHTDFGYINRRTVYLKKLDKGSKTDSQPINRCNKDLVIVSKKVFSSVLDKEPDVETNSETDRLVDNDKTLRKYNIVYNERNNEYVQLSFFKKEPVLYKITDRGDYYALIPINTLNRFENDILSADKTKHKYESQTWYEAVLDLFDSRRSNPEVETDLLYTTPKAAINKAMEDIRRDSSVHFSSIDDVTHVDTIGSMAGTVVTNAYRYDDSDAKKYADRWKTEGFIDSKDTISDNSTELVRDLYKYINDRSEAIKSSLKFFVKSPTTGNYISITDNETVDLIKANESLRRKFLKVVLDTEAFKKSFAIITDLKISSEEDSVNRNLARIKKILEDFNEDTTVREATRIYIDYYLDEISEHPLVKKGLISVDSGFYRSSWLNSHFNDIQENPNPIIQLTLKSTMENFRAARKQAEKYQAEVMDKANAIIEKARKAGKPIDWKNIIDEYNRWKVNYTNKLVTDQREYQSRINASKQKLRALYASEGIQSHNYIKEYKTYLETRLEYNKWKAKHIEQPIVQKYYDDVNKLEEEILGLTSGGLYKAAYSFAIYESLREERDKLRGEVKEGLVDPVIDAKIGDLDKQIRDLQSNFYYDDLTGVFTIKEDHSYGTPTEDELIDYSYTDYTPAVNLRRYIEKRIELEHEYHIKNKAFTFDAEVEHCLNVINNLENKDGFGIPRTPASVLESNEEYKAAKLWLSRNAIRVPEDTKADWYTELKNAQKILHATYDSYFDDEYKALLKDVIRDEYGVLDPSTLDKTQIKKIKDLQSVRYKISSDSPLSDRNLISDTKDTDLIIYNSRFYYALTGGTPKDNKRWQEIVTEINDILGQFYSDATGTILFNEILIRPDAEEILTKLRDLYDELYSFAEDEKDRKDWRLRKDIRDFIETTLTSDENTGAFNADRTLSVSGKTKAYKLLRDIILREDEDFNISANRYIYSRFKLKFDSATALDDYIEGKTVSKHDEYLIKNYVDVEKTKSIRAINKYTYQRPSRYYSQIEANARKGILPEGYSSYDEWYVDNHIYNPNTRRYEPLKCWTVTEYRDNIPHKWIPKASQMERSIRDGYEDDVDKTPDNYNPALDYRNPNYKEGSHASNYKFGSNPEYDNPVTMSKYEQELSDYLQSVIRDIVRYDENGAKYVKAHFVPTKPREHFDKDDFKKGLLRIFGFDASGDTNKPYSSVDYANDVVPVMPGLSMLTTKELVDERKKLDADKIKLKSDKKAGKISEADYLAKMNEWTKKDNNLTDRERKASKDLTTENPLEAIGEFILRGSHYNAVQENKYQMYFVQHILQHYGSYVKKYGGFGDYKQDKEIDENSLEQLETAINRLIRDEWQKPYGNAGKALNVLKSFTSAKYMMLNVKGGIANVTIGETGILGEILAQTHATAKEWGQAKVMYTSCIFDYIANANKETSSTLIGAIIKAFDIIDYDEHTGLGHVTTNPTEILKKIRDAGYTPQTSGEHEMQNSMLIMMLLNHRLIDDTRAAEFGRPAKKIISFDDYIRDIDETALREVIGEDRFAEYLDVQEKVSEDKNKMKPYAEFRRDMTSVWAMNKLNNKEKRAFLAKQKELKKDAKKRFDALPSLMSQLELRNGKLAFKEGSELSRLDVAKYKTDVNGNTILDADRNPIIDKLKPTDAMQLFANFKGRVISVNKKIHGVYDKSGRALIEREWFGGLVMQYHKHLPMGIAKRYRRAGYWNEERLSVEKGMYTSILDFLSIPFRKDKDILQLTDNEVEAAESVQEIFRNVIDFAMHPILNFNLMPEYDKANIRRSLAGVAGTLASLFATIGLRMIWDDEDDSVGFNLAMYEFDRLASEASMYFPFFLVSEGKKTWASPMAAINGVNDLLITTQMLASYILDEDFDPIYHSGKYAGENKILVRLKNNIPIYRGITSSFTDIAENNRYYKVGQNIIGITGSYK